MNCIFKMLGIEKDTKYFVSFKLYKNDIHTDSGRCRITQRGELYFDAVEKQILIHYQKLGEFYTDVLITSITKL